MSHNKWDGWSANHLWPREDPAGYVFLATAFNTIGQAMFPDWTGHEVADAQRLVPPQIPDAQAAYLDGEPHFGFHKHYGPGIRALTKGLAPDEHIPADLWAAVWSDAKRELDRVRNAVFRRDMVVSEMVRLASLGDLTFAARRKGGGSPMLAIDPAMWDLDRPWTPFATLGCDQDHGLGSEAATHWLFVTRISLDQVLGIASEPTPTTHRRTRCSGGEDAGLPIAEAGTAWAGRVPTLEQSLLFQFFSRALVFMPGGAREKNGVELHKTYSAWLAKDHPGSRAVQRTAFLKWLSRFQAGYRIERKSWTLTQ